MVDYGEYFPLSEYYERVVVPLSSRFTKNKKGMYVCCLHEDTDPSLGIIQSKGKGEIFHCFGCNAWGTVVDLHKKVSLKYFNKHIDDDRAIKELCKLFGVDESKVLGTGINAESVEDKYIRRQLALAESMNRFDLGHFQRKIIEGKLEGRGIPYYNTLMVRMIDEYKR